MWYFVLGSFRCGGVSPPPIFRGKKSIGNGYEIVRAAEFFLQIAPGLSAARVSHGPARPW